MSATKVKICGVTRPEDARVAADCGAWAVGLVFYPKSPRFVTAERALAVIAALPAAVLKVGVFMNASVELIRRVERKVPLDLVQLHGRGASEAAKAVGVDRVVLAAMLRAPADVAAYAAQPAAYVLVDRRRVAGRASGASADWGLARRLAANRTGTLLAGALTPENAASAVRAAHPEGVDVSGGVESTPGVKDSERIRAFCDAVRRADADG